MKFYWSNSAKIAPETSKNLSFRVMAKTIEIGHFLWDILIEIHNISTRNSRVVLSECYESIKYLNLNEKLFTL